MFLALAALLVVVLAAVGIATNRDRGITRGDRKVDLASAEETQPSDGDKKYQALCSSSATYSRLKEVAFEEAFRIRNADPANLDTLAASSVVRMENPVLKNRDEDLNVVVCSGRFVLELPPGAERAFGGQRRLTADVEYAAQAAADGSGMVYEMNGAEPIIYKLAAFNLPAGQAPAASEEVEYAEAAPPPAAGGREQEEEETVEEPRATLPPRPTQTARAGEEPETRPTARPSARPSPTPTARAAPKPTPRPTQSARLKEPERPAEPTRTRTASNPSFNCRYARSPSEQMVCSNNRLAAKDRSMSSLFYSALADADPEKRRKLRRTRDRFLAYRDRCGSEACVAEAYDGRVEEIKDIMAGLE